jgi:hypothetical protein
MKFKGGYMKLFLVFFLAMFLLSLAGCSNERYKIYLNETIIIKLDTNTGQTWRLLNIGNGEWAVIKDHKELNK